MRHIAGTTNQPLDALAAAARATAAATRDPALIAQTQLAYARALNHSQRAGEALMVAFDLHLNFMNIFVITMIIGIGVDYGIHVIHRYREADRTPGGDPAAAVEETSRGVFLAALTTIVGFGSLATSHYPGLISMGLVSTIGTLTTAT